MSTADYAARRRQVRVAATNADLSALIVVPGPNMQYLTGLGFHLSERPVLAILAASELMFVAPELERTKIETGAPESRLFGYDDRAGPAAAVTAALDAAELAGVAVGVEDRRIRFLEMDLLAHSGHAPALWGADAVFAELRQRKDAAELAAIRQAVAIAEAAWAATLPVIRAGVSEAEVAGELTVALLRAGSEPELPFFPIVAAGPNGAQPHAVPSDRRLAPGDLVIVDWGARWQGYCSDITRTVAVAGAPVPAELLHAYQAVVAANLAGRAAVRAGASAAAVDRAARDAIAAEGLSEYFVHRTGHGLGLECHEEPNINVGEKAPLPVGAVFTVEPGVYLPGVGGVRIEDDVAVSAGGGETLTSLDRELVAVG